MPDHQTILLALQKGEIDLIFGADGDMIDINSFNVLQKEGNIQRFLANQQLHEPFFLTQSKLITSDAKVREALQYAVHKTMIVEGVLNNSETIAKTLFSPTVPYRYPFGWTELWAC